MKFSSNITPKPLYRSIQECHDELLRRDEKCNISTNLIRTLCKQNRIEHLTIGVKTIVNLGSLLSFLGFSETETQPINCTEQTKEKSKIKECIELGTIKCETLRTTK